MTRISNSWGRVGRVGRLVRESQEGPNVTIQLPREWAEELLRAVATALEVEDMGGEPDAEGMMHMEPDEDDLGGEPDADMDDILGLDGLGGLGSDDDADGDSDDDEDRPAGEPDEVDDDEDDEETDEAAGPVDFSAAGSGLRTKTALGEGSAWRLAEKHIGFKKLKGKLSHEKGVKDPGGLAAAIGRKKFGAKGMAAKSAAGRRK